MKRKFSMDLGYLLVLIALFVQLLLRLAEGDNHSPSTCPESFQCGNLGLLNFPFYNISQLNCGLCMVDCHAKPFPQISLGAAGEWYDAKSTLQGNSIKLHDPIRQTHLDNQSCKSFYNMSLPNSPSISFSFFPSLTLFQCFEDPNFSQNVKEYFNGYSRYNSCVDFSLYYRYPLYNSSSIDIGVGTPPPNCIAIQLPIISSDSNPIHPDAPELFQLLSAEFSLEWHVYDDCYDCHRRGGQCQTEAVTGQFGCADAKKGTPEELAIKVGAVISVAILVILILSQFSFCNLMEFWKSKIEEYRNVEIIPWNYNSLAPKRYSYSDIKKLTNCFKIELGQGGYGCVYKGKLPSGSPVAVKVLKELKGSGEEFENEVASISRTSHVNIVTLLGFCFQDSKRALVYEFMANGSLEKFIYGGKSLNRHLGWQTLYKIAVGIGRGLEYLHRGCNTRILHLDIKPHNILLDEDFCPKISDFGLAKLCPQNESNVSILGARGTVGYIAPEVFCQNIGGVSHKSDVYSYGMMVLEMVGGRKNIDVEVERDSEIYFPYWIYKRLDQGEELGLIGIVNEEDSELARKMIIVSLWCIQNDPSCRPSINKVVEMLEGNHQALQMPPNPSSPSRASESSSTVCVVVS